MSNRKWSDITREERFFTSILFHDMVQEPKPLWRVLRSRLECLADVAVVDLGYEVCFFRDAAHAGLIGREKLQRALEKQTFDLVLWLSNQALVIIEAKAQQGFRTEQMKELHEARRIMLDLSTSTYPMNSIYLVGLCSSRYNPSTTTRKQFDSFLRWNEIADAYPVSGNMYHRADDLYGK